ncbi:MAG: tetratricopeptide repeat protein [Prevotella sp.]|jgi:signal transduction histidine kinase|nr:tetratricopeptide repeat protein [Prevotella sp.]
MKRLYCFCQFLLLSACLATLAAQNQDSIKRVLIDSIRLVESVGNKQLELELSSTLGLLYNMAGKHDSARIYLNRALNLPGGREWHGGRLITNLANSYGFEGRYAEALKYYMEAFKVSEQLATKERTKGQGVGKINVLRTVANIAEIHCLTGNRKQALHYAEYGMKLYAEYAEAGNYSVNYMIPQILYVIGSVHLDNNELDKAETAMRKTCDMALSVCMDMIQNTGSPRNNYMYVAYGKEGLSRVCLARKDYDQAMKYAIEATKYANLNGDPSVTAKTLAAISDIYLAQGNYGESGRLAQKALDLFPAYLDVNPDAAFNVAAANLFAGDKENAYRHFKLYANRMKANTDKLFRETMAGMEIIYETEKKELRIADLEQQKLLYIFIGAFGLVLAIAIWGISRQKTRTEQKEKQLIAANAIFESEKRERERFARDLHDGVNGMLSAIRTELAATEHLQNIRDRIDNCIEEIRRLASGVMPVSLQRYGIKAALEDYCRSFPNVCFHFFGENKRIDEKIEMVVYYCAYELVHNSVKHSGATIINVQLIQENKRISLAVQDNGCGYDKEVAVQGVGIKSLHDRVRALNGKLEIVSSSETGTETTIELKIQKNA